MLHGERGVSVGVAVDSSVGGGTVGVLVGGTSVGMLVGVSVGVLVGVSVGVLVGVSVGVLVGVDVGVFVGVFVGVAVGALVGVFVGSRFGFGRGVLVGGRGVWVGRIRVGKIDSVDVLEASAAGDSVRVGIGVTYCETTSIVKAAIVFMFWTAESTRLWGPKLIGGADDALAPVSAMAETIQNRLNPNALAARTIMGAE